MLELEDYYRRCLDLLDFTEQGKYHFLSDMLTNHHHILNRLYAVEHNRPSLCPSGIIVDSNIPKKRHPYLLTQPALSTFPSGDVFISDISSLTGPEYVKTIETFKLL